MTYLMPNNGKIFVLDLDAKVAVGWMAERGELLEQWAGRIDGQLSEPRLPVEHEYHVWPNGRQALSRDFLSLLAAKGVTRYFVEPAHIKPRVLSFSQPFTAEEVAEFYAACEEVGIVPLGPHFAWARYALAATKTRKQSMNDGRRWYQTNTDAALLAVALSFRNHFDNVLRLHPIDDEESAAAAAKTERLKATRTPVQDRVNELRFETTELPIWAPLDQRVPEKVTHTMAAIVWQHPTWGWGRVKRVYEFHGRAASGRGRASLARAQVAHQQGSASFVRRYGWKAVEWEFERIRANYYGFTFARPFPQPLPDQQEILGSVRKSQLSLFESGSSVPPGSGLPVPDEESAEVESGLGNTGLLRLTSTQTDLLEHPESRPVSTAERRLVFTGDGCIDFEVEST